MKRLICVLLALLMLALPMTALAVDVVSYTADFYVADYADILDDEVEGMIVLNNDQLDKACGAQIVVVTVDTVGESTIENYAYTLFNEWGIGDKNKNNGLLILLAINDGQYWLMPGKGLQDYLSAGELDEMAQEHLLPHAQEGDYQEAVRQMFGACFDYVSVAYDAGVKLDDSLYYTWLQTGGKSESGAVYLSEPVREMPEITAEPVVEVTAEPARQDRSDDDEGGFSFLTLIAILVILLVIVRGIGKVRGGKHRTPPPPPPAGGFRPTPPPTAMHRPVPPPPVSGGYRPTVRPPVGGVGSRPASRPSGGSRPGSFGGSRPGGGMTRGGGVGGSFGRPGGGSRPSGGFSRPSGGSRPSGFGGGRSGGGGMTRGGGSGGSFRGGR